jgi:hypothetical protein
MKDTQHVSDTDFNPAVVKLIERELVGNVMREKDE